jgi:hypothetical protein
MLYNCQTHALEMDVFSSWLGQFIIHAHLYASMIHYYTNYHINYLPIFAIVDMAASTP